MTTRFALSAIIAVVPLVTGCATQPAEQVEKDSGPDDWVILAF